ncbi:MULTISPECIES: AraC family transcriptional regulator [Mesorhizobium]|uniref:helix-turn-helix transcriptional regulator n=2 Tax=Phyllobacteriaceae TaxID=69277 RepID=UPI0013E00EB5|nr:MULTISPECIES: AraC family transcriptional regulator [Mesorhizobium]MCF6125280.1 helix-turn-helix transcriptional regulator [Mesorhizobium ciceri]MCQ8814698.1 helix-turn-helix transcriptional regulator [Mesorhizobium sp. SEMIA396]MCQ8873916.1 helix-turn-helix transcriptional regulator [Mesorhizobium sp. LMG17149]
MSFDMSGHDDAEAERLCAGHFLTVIGEVAIETGLGVLSAVRGVTCGLADLNVMTCFFPPSPLRVRGIGMPGSDKVLMLRSMEGPLVVEQDGRKIEAALGDFLFVSGEMAYDWYLPEGGRLDCGSLPGAAFRVSGETLSRLMLRPIPRTFPPLQLLITYGAYLLMRGPHSANEAEMANAHFNEILPLVVAYLETPSTVERDRLHPVKRYIDDHLGDGDLSISAVAAVLDVTPRYVQKLFQREGTTFSRYLLERRLAEARKLLLRGTGTLSIGATAYEVGFGDISYFNRTFRKRYGVAPSSVRDEARQTLG